MHGPSASPTTTWPTPRADPIRRVESRDDGRAAYERVLELAQQEPVWWFLMKWLSQF